MSFCISIVAAIAGNTVRTLVQVDPEEMGPLLPSRGMEVVLKAHALSLWDEMPLNRTWSGQVHPGQLVGEIWTPVRTAIALKRGSFFFGQARTASVAKPRDLQNQLETKTLTREQRFLKLVIITRRSPIPMAYVGPCPNHARSRHPWR